MATFEQLTGTDLDLELNSADSTVLYTSTRRNRAINMAAEEFADLTECFTRYSSIACSCNTSEYMLLSSGVLSGSTDFVRLAKQGVEYLHTSSNDYVTQLAGDDFPERPLQWRHKQEPSWRSSTTPVQAPTGFYLRDDGGNKYIGLNERPKIGSSETGVLRIPYVARPAPMTSTGDEPFTVNSTTRTDLRIYHKALPHYAAYKLLPLIGDREGANQQLQLFLGYVKRYLDAQRPKGGQHVVMARNYLQQAGRTRDSAVNRTPGWTWY